MQRFYRKHTHKTHTRHAYKQTLDEEFITEFANLRFRKRALGARRKMLLLQIRPLTADTLMIKIKGKNHAHIASAQTFNGSLLHGRSPLYYLLAARALVATIKNFMAAKLEV
jgi:hypothetical protein